MNKQTQNQTVNPRLNFIFKKVSVSKTSLTYWLMLPEFEDEMIAKVDNNETINNQVVLGIMKQIYEKWEHLRESLKEKPDFNYSLARRGIHQLEKAIGNEN